MSAINFNAIVRTYSSHLTANHFSFTAMLRSKKIDKSLLTSPTSGFFQEKCLSLGVPPGPLVAELKSGRDVVLDDGTPVRALDVMEDSTEADHVRV